MKHLTAVAISGGVDYLIQAYKAGKTPNPCMTCNPEIKFGVILSFTRQPRATQLATGHYAQIRMDDRGRYHLFKGYDTSKDQSYFLARPWQNQLANVAALRVRLLNPIMSSVWIPSETD
jgi:tRNA-specific 2-thiouridylase